MFFNFFCSRKESDAQYKQEWEDRARKYKQQVEECSQALEDGEARQPCTKAKESLIDLYTKRYDFIFTIFLVKNNVF